MAEKELRKMNRTELIEIIYALQQNERILRRQNEELRSQLDDKILRMEKAGSIAEAALSLNHIFEDAEAAAQQYLESLRAWQREAVCPAPQEDVAGEPEQPVNEEILERDPL
ncbi:MAG: DNA repair protein [Lachnospiraceae bacterium]|nr:DNA repair protein [Lachnospiraceae bacterium]